MKKIISVSELIAILLCLALSIKLYGQQSFQEITRITLQQDQFFISDIYADGDINGDGRPDLIYAVATHNTSVPYNAQIYIFHDIPDSNSVPDQVLISPVTYTTWYGFSISYSGDLNGDGYDDLVVGAENYGGINGWGAVFIYYGGVSLSPNPDVTLEGINYDNFDPFWLHFGQKVITDCDLNGDGYDDLVVYGDGPQDYWFGHVWAFFGGQQFNTNCAFNKRGNTINERLGEGIAAGDINGDGYDDIIVTKRTNIIDEAHSDVTLEIYQGGDTLNSIPTYSYTIISNGEIVLGDILANGDLNGDSFDDIMVLKHTQTDFILESIYGNSSLDSLIIQSNIMPPFVEKRLLCYCNLDNDLFTDFCMQQLALEQGGTEYGYFLVYEQNTQNLELNYDFANYGDTESSLYGRGYFLGDMNLDNYPEFFVFSHDSSVNHLVNYAAILTEHYVSNDDDVLPIPVSEVQCYPNPFKENVTIKIPDYRPNIRYNIHIFDVKGRLVHQTEDIRSDKYIWHPSSNDKQNLSSGIYFIKASDSNNGIRSSKIIYLK